MEAICKKLRDSNDGWAVRRLSVIKKFDLTLWGAILKGSQEQRGDYFYINQVRDDTRRGRLLRQTLGLGIAPGLEVSYRLGKQTEADKKIAATDIELTDKGIRKAETRLNRMKTPCKGYLTYHSDDRTWTLKSAEIRRVFRPDESAIRDPYLKRFCMKYACADGRSVIFYLDEQGAPFNICGDRDRISPEPYGVGITVDDARAWKDYQRAFSMLGSYRDPYLNHPFHSLAPLKEDAEAPLTWR